MIARWQRILLLCILLATASWLVWQWPHSPGRAGLGALVPLCVDLVVCDMASHVLAVIEIRQPSAQETDRTRRRHTRTDKVLRAPSAVRPANGAGDVEGTRAEEVIAKPQALPASGHFPQRCPP